MLIGEFRNMEGIVTSKNFRKFYEELSEDVSSIKAFFTLMKKATANLAEDLKLGRCEMVVNSPSSSLEFEGIQDRTVFWADERGYNPTNGVRRTSVTGDWGILQLEVYALDGVEWTEEEEAEVSFLIQIIFDICSKVRAKILVSQAIITDTVTGACNAQGVNNYCTELYKKSKLVNYNAIYLNIKNFNYLNQRVGNEQADKVMKNFSFMIREYLDQGELFGRLGGDNFFVLVEKERTDECIKFLTTRRVLIELEKKTMEFDLMVRLGVYSIYPSDTPGRVTDAAKAAYAYTRNPSAGNIIWFKEDMLLSAENDQRVSQEFQTALKKKEFVVYYQPKVDLNTSKLVSAEALCRWMRDGEIVPPMEFIPALERDGAICDLDFYMLNTVCDHIQDWVARGIEPVRISVNFSRTHILNKKLADKIIKVIDSHKVSTEYIEVEITEMSGYEDFESLVEFVNEMKINGITTSLDDFGTGYSSLNLIKDLNVDIIKLDKTFLENVTKAEEGNDKSVIRSIINMVNELDMNVVAEGVETNEQVEFLKEANCQVAQGFLFDKPMPKEKFEFRLIGERMY